MNSLTRREALQVMLGACSLPLAGALTSCSPAKAEQVVISPGEGGSLDVSDVLVDSGFGVSTSCAPATEIGMEVLRAGGNAVDAAIAVSYALGVCQPYGSGIGGGGGMLVFDLQKNRGTFIDYYDAAPHSFASLAGSPCVPGLVKGMERAHELFGTMDMPSLIQPSIDVAREGFEVSEKLATMVSGYAGAVQDVPGYQTSSGLVGEGDVLTQKVMAEALEMIRDGGAEVFYQGDLAREIASATGFTLDDLASYTPVVRDAVAAECCGCTVYSAPSPLGGVTFLEMLKMMDMQGAPSAESDTPGYLAALEQAASLASAVRARYIADPAYVVVEEEKLLSEAYLQSVLSGQDMSISADLDNQESESTTSFAIIDKDGLIVSATNTLGNFFGSGQVVHGFHLNSHMGSFSSIGANRYEPGKRPRSFTASSVVVGDSFAFGIGTPGGRRIPQVLVGVLYDILIGGEDVQTAVDKNRALFLDGSLYLEKLDNHDDLVDAGEASAYPVIRKGKGDLFGAVQIMGCMQRAKLFGATDDRREGSFAVEEE